MNREQQSGGGLEYRQQGRRSEEGDWTDSRESRGSSGEENQRRDDDTSNRRRVHERDPTADEDRTEERSR